jgi:two-component system, OmpR family, response regulator
MIKTNALDILQAARQSLGQAIAAGAGPSDFDLVTELLVRMEALLQRRDEHGETALSAGSLRINRLTRIVTRGERTIRLLPREYVLLEYLMRHRDQLVTRAMLFTEVWGYKFVPRSNLVDVHMGRLRRKIDQPNETPMIHSVRGRGFVLRAAV